MDNLSLCVDVGPVVEEVVWVGAVLLGGETGIFFLKAKLVFLKLFLTHRIVVGGSHGHATWLHIGVSVTHG